MPDLKTAEKNAVVTKKLVLELLPSFASWILQNHLERFVRIQLDLSRKENIPLLRLFSGFTDEQLVEMGKVSGTELLQGLADNKATEFIAEAVKKWISNQLELIDKSQVVAEDIALVSLVRRQAFRLLLEEFTSDIRKFRATMVEVDRFTTASDMAYFNTYFQIQQEQLHKMNEKLEVQQRDLLEAQELAKMGSFYWDLEGSGRSQFTPNTLRIFEMEKTSNLESFLSDVHPEDRLKVTDSIKRAVQSDGIYECEYRYHRNGKHKTIWSRGVVIFDGRKPLGMKGTVMDVTDRYELLEKLSENERLFRNAEAITHIGNWSWNVTDNSIRWSDEMYRIYGLEPQSEIITFDRFISLVHPDNREKRLREIERALQTGEPDDYFLRIVTPSGEEKMLRGKGEIEKDAEGRPVRFNGTCQDITREYELNKNLAEKARQLEQKNRELERTNQELESFNYAASHDLQEPLRKIQVFANRILEEEIPVDARLKSYLEKIRGSAARMQRLIDDLLVFSQTASLGGPQEEVELSNLLTDARLTLTHRIEETKARVSYSLLPKVRVVPFQFQQVFTNILSNAIKYRKETTSPEVWIDSTIVSGVQAGLPVYDDSSYLRISIRDNGIGFDPQFSDRLFDLFSRLHTKDKYSGTGIGLAICKKIVQNHQGFIRAESDGENGATFHIFLPEDRVVNHAIS